MILKKSRVIARGVRTLRFLITRGESNMSNLIEIFINIRIIKKMSSNLSVVCFIHISCTSSGTVSCLSEVTDDERGNCIAISGSVIYRGQQLAWISAGENKLGLTEKR